MSTLTPTELEALKRSGNISSYYSDETETEITADKFIGNLEGNADTATQLSKASTINVTGDATGSVSLYGNDANSLELTVTHSTSADRASVADTADSVTRARRADLANLATLAYNSIDSLHALSSDEATHAESADEATHAGSSDLATRAETADKAITDENGTNLATKLADLQSQITVNANKNTQQDGRLTTLEGTTSTHTSQIGNIQIKNTTQDNRLTALEDYTNVLDWNIATTYSAGNIALYQYNFYQSLVDNNTGNNPTDLDSAYWKILSETAGSGTADCVHLAGTETVTGDKDFTGALTAVTQTANDNSTNVATTAYTDEAISTLNTSLASSITTTALTVNGNASISGTTTGTFSGNLTGDVTGNLTGNVTGDVTGDVSGDVNGNVTGNVTGDVVGNLSGNVTGDLTGTASRATADASGNVITDTYHTISAFDSYVLSVKNDIANVVTEFGGVNLLSFS